MFAEKSETVRKPSPPPFRISDAKIVANMCISGIRVLWLENGAFFRLEPMPSSVAKNGPGPPQLRCGSQTAPILPATGL